MIPFRFQQLIPLVITVFLPGADGRVSNAQETATAVLDPSSSTSSHVITSSRRVGEKCGGLFNSDECARGLTCVKAVVGGGRCMPVECIMNAIQKYNQQNSLTGLDIQSVLTQQIFEKAGVTPEQLATSRANEARSDQTFLEDSNAMQAIVEVLKNMEFPFPGLQKDLEACNAGISYEGDEKSATPGQTNYCGFHIEGGALYDGEFSVMVAPPDEGSDDPNLTWIRGCFGGGGVGFDISAVIGIGYTGARDELMGCSALLTDNELGAVFAAGMDLGVTFPGVYYLDVTLGAGLTGEGLGIGLCGNWPA